MALALLLAGCPNGSAPTTLTVWAMGREGEAVQPLMAEFERAHPGVRVRVQQIPWSAAHEKLLTAFAGDALPDVIQLGNTWIPEFAALEALLPLDGGLEPGTVQDLFPGILASSQVDGHLMAMPWYVDTRVLFYRKDLLTRAGYARPPRDWREWQAAMAAIQALPGDDRSALLLPLNEWQPLAILALQAGSTLLRDGDRYGDFRGEAFARAFRLYVDFFRRGFAPAVAEAHMSNLYQDFAQGRYGFYISGPWMVGEFRQRLPADQQSRWDTAPMPGPEGPGLSLAGGSSLAVCRQTRHPQTALALVQFLTEPARGLAFYRLTGDLPARRSAWAAPALRQVPQIEAFRQQLNAVVPTPRVPEWEQIADKMKYYAEQAVRGDLTEAAALAALDAAVDRMLAKRRWLLAKESQKSGQTP